MIRTVRIGPIEAMPTKPKLSSEASSVLECLRTAATPMPKARIKGTVIGPVVAPPASNPIPTNSGLVKKAHTNSTR